MTRSSPPCVGMPTFLCAARAKRLVNVGSEVEHGVSAFALPVWEPNQLRRAAWLVGRLKINGMANMEVRSTDEFSEIVWILSQLGERLPQLRNNNLYLASIPIYVSSGAYKFLVAGPDGAAGSPEDWTAFGFVTFYRAPMMERIVLAVEAFWFAEDQLDVQLPVWRAIASLTKRMKFHGICVSERSINTPNALNDLVARGDLGGDPVARATIRLQAEVGNIYSAFSDGPLGTAVFPATCIRVYTLRLLVDLKGVSCANDVQFYRGEGRLENLPHWRCRDMNELTAWFKKHGFSARKAGPFAGALQEQMLQQGYVNQPTVSLSKSFKVAAYYATNGNTCNEAVVFEIDGRLLRQYGEIYDSFATMVKHCQWLSPREFETLRAVVKILGVLKAGRFLANCYEQTRLWVERYRHLPDVIAPKLDWNTILDETDLDNLARGEITEGALNGLRYTFQTFWMFALGQIGSVDTITLVNEEREESVETKPVGPFPYYVGFQQVEDRLKEALAGQTAAHRHPGWDLTAFGYMAKTCRDEEFFSTGPIPGECIVKATVVGPERRGDRQEGGA